MLDFDSARHAMISSQIMPNGVRNPRVLKAFGLVPRELFVPDHKRKLAYMDEAIELVSASPGQPARFLLPPMILAKLLEHADIKPADKVLDAGGGSGYSTAVLAGLGARIVLLEDNATLARKAESLLKQLKIGNAAVVEGPLAKGYYPGKPFDVIILNGAVAEEPSELLGQLSEGGRLAVILGTGPGSKAFLYRNAGGMTSGRPIFDAGAATLPGFEDKPAFVF